MNQAPHVSRRALLRLATAAGAVNLIVPGSGALAQPAYPAKPIRLIVPFPPGGGTDILTRVVGQEMSKQLGQPVVVENKPGAGGNIGVDLAAKAPADGYTLVMGQTSNLAINPTLYAKLPYDPVKDLSPIALVASAPLVLVVASGAPYRSLADALAAAKANPGAITFASPGNGTVAHLTGELLQRSAGAKFEHIPYKGSSQAMVDIMGGVVQLFMASIPTALAQIKAGKLRPLAVTSITRVIELPDVPTVDESGLPGFEASTWFGFLARAGTPQPVIARLSVEVNRALQVPIVRERIAGEGAVATGGSPEQFAALLREDLMKWGRVVKESGAKLD